MKQCDISKVEPLLKLLRTPANGRDAAWSESFYSTVVDASFRCETPQIFNGPDGFPYFSLLSPEPLKTFDSFCICNLVEPATEKGFGIAINRQADGVDWVFSYGDLLTLRLTGSLKSSSVLSPEPPKTITIEKEETVLLGAPSESYLPSYARAVIRAFMQQSLCVKEPQVFLMHRAADSRPMQLVFSVFREQFQTDETYFNALNHLSWFLPRHYSITGIPMSSDMRKNFAPL
jgi:hypothetical protein